MISYPLMRLSDAAAVITTFALLVIIHVVLLHWDRVTNGPRTLFGVDNYTNLWTSVVFAVITIFAGVPVQGVTRRAAPARHPRRPVRRRLDRDQHGG